MVSAENKLPAVQASRLRSMEEMQVRRSLLVAHVLEEVPT